MTEAQREWFRLNPEYVLVGPPRPRPHFNRAGTLYADGTFDRMGPGKPIRLQDGCKLVGIPDTRR